MLVFWGIGQGWVFEIYFYWFMYKCQSFHQTVTGKAHTVVRVVNLATLSPAPLAKEIQSKVHSKAVGFFCLWHMGPYIFHEDIICLFVLFYGI